MTSLAEIRSGGTTIVVPARHIPEPINAPEPLRSKLGRFGPELYNLNRNSHLYRFLTALAGDAGAGALKRDLLYPRLHQMIEATHYGDLDRVFGNPLGLPRLKSLDYLGNPLELYDTNPETDSLADAEWQIVRSRDANYRARCLTWMRAIMAGPTREGIALAGEAALGTECDVFENFQFIDNQASDDPITLTDVGQTDSPNEFVIIPRLPAITQEERRRIVHLVDLLRPVDSLPTVFAGDRLRSERAILQEAASSEYFTISRLVTGREDVVWPDTDPGLGYWIEAGTEKETPTFSWLSRQEIVTFLSVSSASASSTHVGTFNVNQTVTFAHLATVSDNFQSFDPVDAYAPNYAPLLFATTWLNRG